MRCKTPGRDGLRLTAMTLGLALFALAGPGMAMTVTAPTAGVLPKAAPVTVQWSTSTPAASVVIMLFQVTPSANFIPTVGWSPISNTGQTTLTFPPSVICEARHSYKIGVSVFGTAASGHFSGPAIVEAGESKPFRLSCEGDGVGALTVVKTVVADSTIPPPKGPFLVNVICTPNGPNTTVSLSSANGYQQVVPRIPAGSACTVTEQPPVVPADLARLGCHWETSYPGQGADAGPRTALTSGANITRRVVNRWACKTGAGNGVGPRGDEVLAPPRGR